MTGAPASPGAWLRARREALALTRAQLAAALGCSASGLGNVETGTRDPSREWWALADGMLDAGGELLRLAEQDARCARPAR